MDSIKNGLHKELRIHSEIKWSDIARQAFERKIRELHWMDTTLKNSVLTEKDADIIGHKIKAEMRKRFS
ncbi:hypothetical protein HYY69_02870 [Candidatus Woesearchaeota archaeon]|nr:hypothetical protein [Candidatus Woesearchaeota archaeon]